MSNTTHDLAHLQDTLTRYGMTSYLVLGNIGNCFNIIVFTQAEQRRNACSLFLLATAVCNCLSLNIGLFSSIHALYHVDLITRYLLVCKTQFYLRHTCLQMMRSYKILACINLCTLCSTDDRIRRFSRPMTARRSILFIGLFWAAVVIFFAAVRTIQHNACSIFNDPYALIYTIYFAFSVGILTPILMSICSILVIRNLQKTRSRSRLINTNRQKRVSTHVLRKRDRDLIRMLLVDILVYIVTTVPLSVFLVYRIVTQESNKTRQNLQVESFINYMCQTFMMYLNTALPFWIYLSTSGSFRGQSLRIIIEVYAFLIGKYINKDIHGARSSSFSTINELTRRPRGGMDSRQCTTTRRSAF